MHGKEKRKCGRYDRDTQWHCTGEQEIYTLSQAKSDFVSGDKRGPGGTLTSAASSQICEHHRVQALCRDFLRVATVETAAQKVVCYIYMYIYICVYIYICIYICNVYVFIYM